MNCTTMGCVNKVLCKNLCSKCYYRVKRGGTPTLSKRQQQALRKCAMIACGKPHHSSGLCINHYKVKRRADNPAIRQKELEFTRKWKAANPEKHAKQQSRQHERNKDERNAYVAQWKRDNWDTYKNYMYARKDRVKQATPSWVDLKEIERIYRECPEGYHVDHIEPIKGKNVSGLHVPWNLQYLPAIENLRKSNKRAA